MYRVLVVEDSPTQARRVSATLEGQGFAVDVAGTLADGLDRLRKGGIDVILLDLTLPDSEGFATFLRTRSGSQGAPIVVFTSIDEESLAETALRSGAQDYLVKGQVTDSWIGRSLRFAIERHRAELPKAPQLPTAAPPAPVPSANVQIDRSDRATIVRIREKRLMNDVVIERTGLQLVGEIDRDNKRQLVVDFADVEYLSNAALGMLVMLTKKVRGAKGQLRLCNIRPELHEHFEVRKLDKMFEIHPTEQSALDSLAS